MNFSSFISFKSVLLNTVSFVICLTSFSQTQKGDGICVGLSGAQLLPTNGMISVDMPNAYTIGIGGPRSFGSADNSGITRIYEWNGVEWLQKGSDIFGEGFEDNAGNSVSMPDENTIAIGALLNDGNGTNAGHVRVYTWNGLAWIKKGLDIEGENAGDHAGYKVSMPDINTVAVSAIYNNDNGTGAGHTRVFEWDGSNWIQKGTDIDGEFAQDKSGYSISMPDANTLAIGAIQHNDSRGNVRIFEWNGSAWVQKGTEVEGDNVADYLGWSVSMPDANTFAVGGTGYDGIGTNSGYTKIFEWDGSSWVQKGTDIIGEADGDESGYSVSMPNPNTVAIGAHLNSDNATGAGHVRVFDWDGNAWIQKGVDIDAATSFENAGRSISMPDTNTVAMGSDYSDICGSTNAGGVFVYDFCSPVIQTDVITACDSYTWIDGNTYTSNTTASVYNFLGGASNGCDSVVTLDLTINTVDNSVYRSGSTLEAIETGATYQWVDCNDNYAPIAGETDDTFTATANGSYALVVTKNNCTDTSNCFNMTTVGLAYEKDQDENLTIYPNPSTGIFNVAYTGSQQVRYTLSDISGRIIKTGYISNDNTLLDLSSESKGTYFLKSLGKTHKIIKK